MVVRGRWLRLLVALWLVSLAGVMVSIVSGGSLMFACFFWAQIVLGGQVAWSAGALTGERVLQWRR